MADDWTIGERLGIAAGVAGVVLVLGSYIFGGRSATQGNESQLEKITKDVIGGSAPETFYEIKGGRVYLEIDGKPVENYVGRK
tara:strand:- start:835 stop:1083 length:249 start_codon:yes stop_codon:yes gene_type:complete